MEYCLKTMIGTIPIVHGGRDPGSGASREPRHRETSPRSCGLKGNALLSLAGTARYSS